MENSDGINRECKYSYAAGSNNKVNKLPYVQVNESSDSEFANRRFDYRPARVACLCTRILFVRLGFGLKWSGTMSSRGMGKGSTKNGTSDP